MEDVINHSSNHNLKFRSIFTFIQPNPRVPQLSKFWSPPIQTSSLIFMIVRTQQVYIPALFCLGPADRFLAVLCVCSGLFGNRLVASLLETYSHQNVVVVHCSMIDVREKITQYLLIVVIANPFLDLTKLDSII